MRFIFLILGLVVSQLNAESLTFEVTSKEITVKPDVKVLEILFPFKNNSGEAVDITAYDAPCSCMSAKLKGGKTQSNNTIRFEPGDEGVVKAIFDMGNFKGTKDQKIFLWTSKDSKEKPSIVLTTQVTIPELVTASPSSLKWALKSKPETQEITIKVSGEKPIKVTGAQSSNENIQCEVVPVKEGFEYKLKITPDSTDSILFASVKISTDSPIDRFKTLQTFVTVKPEK